MFKPISKDAQGQGLRVSDCLIARGSIGEHARQLGNLRQPATVLFLIHF